MSAFLQSIWVSVIFCTTTHAGTLMGFVHMGTVPLLSLSLPHDPMVRYRRKDEGFAPWTECSSLPVLSVIYKSNCLHEWVNEISSGIAYMVLCTIVSHVYLQFKAVLYFSVWMKEEKRMKINVLYFSELVSIETVTFYYGAYSFQRKCLIIRKLGFWMIICNKRGNFFCRNHSSSQFGARYLKR